jgi:dipeptidyl-peptidase-4
MTQPDLLSRYQRAQTLMQGIYSKDIAYNTTLYPHWIGDTDSFWYQQHSAQGHCFQRVDGASQTHTEAFDHQALARALSSASGETFAADQLPISELDLSAAPASVGFTAQGKRWQYSAAQDSCAELPSLPPNWALSPDGRKALFVREHNLWLQDIATGEERALTHDGEAFYRYASTPSVYGRQEFITLEALWSPDSKRVFTQVLDTRDVAIAPPMVEYVPADGSLRPTIRNPERRMAFTGDEQIEQYRFLSIEINSGQRQFADHPPCPVARPPYVGYFTSHRGWWDKDNRRAYFIDHARGGRQVRLIQWDSHTGHCKTLIEEHNDFTVTLTPISHIRMPIYPLVESDELIWYSERSGHAHLYLYELSTGQLKHAITQGEWLVRNVLHIDRERRELWIQTAGREPGRNPYYCDICRVNIDTGERVTVLASDHEYVVCDQRSRHSIPAPQAMGVSPSGNFVVATRSRVDQVPVSVLVDRNGQQHTVETAKVSGLPENVNWPEPVMLKAADGKTDIYGVIFRPSNFDPSRRYPVLDCTYNYATPVGSFSNNTTHDRHYLSAWAYAELGFICVMIFNRGNEGLRDTAFNSYQDPKLPLEAMRFRFNKEDCVAGIQQLAEQHSYMDLDRVGVVEFGSIPTAVAGLLLYPDFYQVGVSINAQTDSRLFGCIATQDEGYPELEDFAENLQGKLLLIHGMLEDVITPAMMFRLVEALQKANKRFDMLLLPNLGHGSSSYTIQRSWDYVVEHLLGEEPPVAFKLETVFG